MNEKNIVLIGFMGTGKTTTGRTLAERLNRKFLDSDYCIEERYKMSILDIFALYGEERFRKLEQDTINDISREKNAVISTGGGIVLKEENIIKLRENGKLYLLSGSLETIISNLKASTDDRPLLNGKDWIINVEKLLNFRLHLYHNAADYIVDINKKSTLNIVDEILKIHCNIKPYKMI